MANTINQYSLMNSRLNSMNSGLNLIKSSTNTNKTGDIFSLARDHSLMKSTGYRSLVGSYYAKSAINKAESNSEIELNKDYTDVKKEATTLVDSTRTLYTTGEESLFKVDSEGKVDTEKLHKAVNSFVDSYNNTLKKTLDSGNTALVNMGNTLKTTTSAYEGLLKRVGINISEDGSLKVDEEALGKSEVSDLKVLFNDTSSYGYNINAQAMSISSTSVLQSTYGNNGAYTYAYGAIFSNYA